MQDRAAIEQLLAGVRRIAVVGASDRPGRPSHGVVARLLARGYDVVPVTPTYAVVHGIPTVASLAEVEGPVDLVDVFRRPPEVPGVASAAVAIGAGGLWLQSGIRSPAARAIADAARLPYVEDACLAVVVEQLDARPVEVEG